MEIIVPEELQSYFAILFQIITVDEILDINYAPIKKKLNSNYTGQSWDHFRYKFHLKYEKNPKKNIKYEFLPIKRVPHSIIKIWALKTKVKYNKNSLNKYYDRGGYCSHSEIYSDMLSWYDFYIVERYVKYIKIHQNTLKYIKIHIKIDICQ